MVILKRDYFKMQVLRMLIVTINDVEYLCNLHTKNVNAKITAKVQLYILAWHYILQNFSKD